MINNILYEMYECDLNFEVDAVLYMIINSKITYNSTFYKCMYIANTDIDIYIYTNIVLTEAVDQLVLHSKC